ncbi:hypothetical protein MMC09_000402 [Bachmanniomyces sp. S44760]|nr:hypothetical protein [Bachmanniomyces sp. S44760]
MAEHPNLRHYVSIVYNGLCLSTLGGNEWAQATRSITGVIKYIQHFSVEQIHGAIILLCSMIMASPEDPTLSPDPIGLLPVPPSPGSRRSLSVSPRKPLGDSDGNIRLQDFYMTTPPPYRTSTPSKSMVQTENLLSPWRIRVMVEAEPNEGGQLDMKASPSPSKRIAERSITTTVPVKGLSPSPTPAKRGRGRPKGSLNRYQKSEETPKAGTTRRQTVQGDMEANTFSRLTDFGPTPPRNLRGRPRNSVGDKVGSAGVSNEIAGTSPSVLSPNGFRALSNSNVTSRRKSKGRRKEITPLKLSGHNDTRMRESPTNQDESSETSPTFNEQLEHSISSPVDDQERAKIDLAHESLEHLVGFRNMSQNVEQIEANELRGITDKGDKTSTDPTDEHQEFDSILESEEFTMVSLSTLPSAKQHLSPFLETRDVDTTGSTVYDNNKGLDQDSSVQKYLEMPELPALALDSLDGRSASTPAKFASEKTVYRRTPARPRVTPSMPPAIEIARRSSSPRYLDQPSDTTPKLARVIRSGDALQQALIPQTSDAQTTTAQNGSNSPSSKRPLDDSADDILGGFGAGTRRELRAGLRFGEELAKRQKIAAKAAAAVEMVQVDIFREDGCEKGTSRRSEQYTLRSPPTQEQVHYPTLPNPQLPSPDDSVEIVQDEDQMDWKAETPGKTESTNNPLSLETSSPADHAPSFLDRSVVDNTMMAREIEWQKEREIVSRQIQMANSSQVIVIGDETRDGTFSTDNDEEDDIFEIKVQDEVTEDVWQEEANSSGHSQQLLPEAPEVPSATETLFPDQIIKPRRSKLPSPWRRQSHIVYSDEPSYYEGPSLSPDVQQYKHVSDDSDDHLTGSAPLEELRTPVFAAQTSSPVSDDAIEDDEDDDAGTLSVILDDSSVFDGFSSDGHLSGAESVARATPSMSTGEKDVSGHEMVAKDLQYSRNAISSNEKDRFQHKRHGKCFHGECNSDGLACWIHSTHYSPAGTSSSMPQDSPFQEKPTKASWFSGLGSLVPFWKPKINDPQNASNSESSLFITPSWKPKEWQRVANSSPTHLSVYLPFTVMHWKLLREAYVIGCDKLSHKPYNPNGRSAVLLGKVIINQAKGCEMKIKQWHLAIVDGYLKYLREVGVDDRQIMGYSLGGRHREAIDEYQVAKSVFGIWYQSARAGKVQVGKDNKL